VLAPQKRRFGRFAQQLQEQPPKRWQRLVLLPQEPLWQRLQQQPQLERVRLWQPPQLLLLLELEQPKRLQQRRQRPVLVQLWRR
jgi:hypothetical protein